jgi:hypothetical protein
MSKNVYEVAVRRTDTKFYRVEADDEASAGYEVQHMERNGVLPIFTKHTWDVKNVKLIEEVKAPAESMDRFPRIVVCEWCGNKYRSVAPDPKDISKQSKVQGDDCCAHVYYKDGDWFLVGGYGSGGYDMDIYKFVKNLPTRKAQVVCDGCIGERRSAGDIIKVGTDEP